MSTETTKLSEDRKRGLDYSPVFAIAAYEIREHDGRLIGHHCGIFERRVDAEKWLKTGKPQPTRIHGAFSA